METKEYPIRCTGCMPSYVTSFQRKGAYFSLYDSERSREMNYCDQDVF